MSERENAKSEILKECGKVVERGEKERALGPISNTSIEWTPNCCLGALISRREN